MTATALTGRKPSLFINADKGDTGADEVLGLVKWSYKANPAKIELTSAQSGDFKEYKFGRKEGEITIELRVETADSAFISALASGLSTPVDCYFRTDAEQEEADFAWSCLLVGDLDTGGLDAAAARTVTALHVDDL